MKNKNIFFKIYISFLIICFIILDILGKKNIVGYLGDLKEVCIKYILKRPISYLNNIINYMNVIFYLPTPILNDESIQSKSNYYDNNVITFISLRKTIYNVLYYTLLWINILVFIITAIVIFFISGLTCVFRSDYKYNMLLLVFFSSFTSFATSMIVGLFTSLPMYRYIYPVIPMSKYH